MRADFEKSFCVQEAFGRNVIQFSNDTHKLGMSLSDLIHVRNMSDNDSASVALLRQAIPQFEKVCRRAGWLYEVGGLGYVDMRWEGLGGWVVGVA